MAQLTILIRRTLSLNRIITDNKVRYRLGQRSGQRGGFEIKRSRVRYSPFEYNRQAQSAHAHVCSSVAKQYN